MMTGYELLRDKEILLEQWYEMDLKSRPCESYLLDFSTTESSKNQPNRVNQDYDDYWV